VRQALADSTDPIWIVGGTVRDALLARPIRDVDLAVGGDPEPPARAVAAAIGGPVFPLSEAFGAWRAIDRSRSWVCDVSPLHGESLDADLAARDFTVNAMAVPLQGGELVDPHGGLSDLEAGRLRITGPAAYERDALRPLRLVRLAAELALEPDPETERLTLAAAARVADASPERVFAELRRLLLADRAVEGLELADRLGVLAPVLPELDALHGVEQSGFHHLDVYDHTLEVLRQQIALEQRIEELFGDAGPAVAQTLDRPLADELTRGQALRLAALLHDVGKPATRRVRPDGRVTFIGHDAVGQDLVAAICRRLRTSERLRRYLGELTRCHLVLGFLVHERPLSRRAVYRYLATCRPVEVEVTVLSCADRLATRGRNAEPAIAAHLELARELMGEALAWRASDGPRPPIRGDDLASELEIEPGPEIGALLAQLEEAAFAGEIRSRDEALELARRLRENPDR
jgi:putative nucleotidyltransferase with HDIG domain